jgi:Mg2+ and Co2+ transporter CorA
MNSYKEAESIETKLHREIQDIYGELSRMRDAEKAMRKRLQILHAAAKALAKLNPDKI